MNAQIINAFGRKEGDPLPGQDEGDKPKVCEHTVKLLEVFLADAKAGVLRGVAVAGIAHGGPVLSVVVPDDADIRDFAVLTLASRMVYGQMLGIAAGSSTVADVDDEEDEE